MKPATYAFLIFSICLGFAMPAQGQAVQAWQGTIDLPTYLLGDEDPNPPFPVAGRHRTYPYTMLDDLTDRRETKTYKAVFLENEFLKAIVLPELGGRLYSVYDKISQREVFYRNNVVKYGLVSLRGAWVSGGIEFNFPDGHTVVTVSPVASKIEQNPDGSGTVIVGDMDWVTGMHWEVALTLRPGQARVEQRVTLFNDTPATHRYWYWANAAVPATDDMQFIYPMREAYPHLKGVVWSYPLHEGVDYSWYKNVREPSSLFARQVHREFFGAYYHQADYGVVHVADFREVPGKKVWTWGVAEDGLIWTNLLTDRDGPYNEIQSGRYQTQLNYEFMPPRQAESWTEYWYPVRGLDGGFVEAGAQGALNVRFLPASGGEKARVELRISPATEIGNAVLRVKPATQAAREFGPLSLRPLAPQTFTVPVENLEAEKKGFAVDLVSSAGLNLLHWSAAEPVDGNADFVPAAGAAAPPAVPLEKMTVEQLFLHGEEEEKDGREAAAAETYQQVLERDPGYIPALLKLAWRAYAGADLATAQNLVARAMGRDVTNTQVFYAAGVFYRAAQRPTLSQDAFWAAIQYGGPAAPALAQLGEISIDLKHYDEAAHLLRRARSYNADDALVLTDLAAALRLGGQLPEAREAVGQALAKAPLLPMALAEQWRIRGAATAAPAEWARWLPADVENYLEVAAWYRGLGDLASSDAVLEAARKNLPPERLSPMVDYYGVANAREEGDAPRADRLALQAAAGPYARVFPNRLEDVRVLVEALQQNPTDAHAQFFLGNFLFAHGRYDAAANLWAQALGEGFESSVLMRNLGLYGWRIKKDLPGAAGFYESAVRLDPGDFRHYVDLDEIYFQLGDLARREKLFAAAPESVLARDTVRVRRALWLVQEKRFDEALKLLSDRSFKPWEGGVTVREVFVVANLRKGRELLAARKFEDAEKSLREALTYPHSLGVGKPDKPHDEQALYWLGLALEAQGKNDGARDAWRQAADEGKGAYGTSRVFAGLALRKLGESAEADKTLDSVLQASREEKPSANDLYLAGLLSLAESHGEEAQGYFRRAVELDPTLWQARIELEATGL